MGDATDTERHHPSDSVALGNRMAGRNDAAFAAKLRPPQLRPGVVPRTKLVDRLLASDSERVVAVVAPPGYGKTTVLAEWASKQPRDIAWVSIDTSDNDPAALLAATAHAVSRAT